MVLCSAPAFILFLWLTMHRYTMRNSLSEGVAEQGDQISLVKLSFHCDEVDDLLEWEHATEFQWRGMMYDVVKSIVHGDSIHYHCYPDGQETHLRESLMKHLGIFRIAFGESPVSKNESVKHQPWILFCHEKLVLKPTAVQSNLETKLYCFYLHDAPTVIFQPPETSACA